MRMAFLCSKLSSPTLGVCSIEPANSVFPNILGLNNYKFSLQMLHVSFLPHDKRNCPIPKEKNALIYENYNCATVKYSESGTIQHGGCCRLPASISDMRCSIQSIYRSVLHTDENAFLSTPFCQTTKDFKASCLLVSNLARINI